MLKTPHRRYFASLSRQMNSCSVFFPMFCVSPLESFPFESSTQSGFLDRTKVSQWSISSFSAYESTGETSPIPRNLVKLSSENDCLRRGFHQTTRTFYLDSFLARQDAYVRRPRIRRTFPDLEFFAAGRFIIGPLKFRHYARNTSSCLFKPVFGVNAYSDFSVP